MEGYSNAGPLNGTAANAAPVSGGRRRSHKKLRLVKKKTVRKMLSKMGLKMRGGAGEPMASGPASPPATNTGGRRRRRGGDEPEAAVGVTAGRRRRHRSRKFLGLF